MKGINSCILILSLFSPFCYSKGLLEVQCWSGEKEMYNGYSENVVFDDNFLFFTDLSTNRQIYINGDCMISYDESLKYDPIKSKRK